MTSICMFSGELYSTLAVFCNNCITIETWGTPLTFGSSCVTPAMLTVARYIVALIDNQVRVWVAIAVTSLTGVTDCCWVPIVTGGTSNCKNNHNSWYKHRKTWQIGNWMHKSCTEVKQGQQIRGNLSCGSIVLNETAFFQFQGPVVAQWGTPWCIVKSLLSSVTDLSQKCPA